LPLEIFASYSSQSFISGGDSYILNAHVNSFVDDCLTYDLGIIGIDGFELKGGNLKPLLDAVADFSTVQVESWDEFKERCRNLACLFLKEYSDQDDIVWNFSLIERDSWQQTY
jgi:hypothetical protein